MGTISQRTSSSSGGSKRQLMSLSRAPGAAFANSSGALSTAAGKHCGRPKRALYLRPGVALLREGRALKEAARFLRGDRNTMRRRLREAWMWPPTSAEQIAG